MAYTKIKAKNKYFFIEYSDGSINIVKPNNYAIQITKADFVKLLNFYKSYEYLLSKQKSKDTYYDKAYDNDDFGFYTSTEDEPIELFNVVPGNTNNKYTPVTINEVSVDDGSVSTVATFDIDELTAIIDFAATQGITSDAKSYDGIQFVEKLPSTVSAKKDAVYFCDAKYYKLSDDETTWDEISSPELTYKLPVAEPTAQEGVYYNLTRVQEEPLFGLKLEPAIYTYIASDNEFKKEDLSLQKVKRLPKAQYAKENVIYELTKDEVVDENTTLEKGTRYAVKSEYVGKEEQPEKNSDAFDKYTKKLVNVLRVPLDKIAKDQTYYIYDGYVFYFTTADGFKRIGKLLKAHTLPLISKITINPDMIYTLTKSDGDKIVNSKWVYDNDAKEFKEYKDSMENETKKPSKSNNKGKKSTSNGENPQE